MSAPVAISTLLAIAIVRRLLLELKVPEEENPACVLGGPIELWVSLPLEDFDGQSPTQALAAPGGDDIVLAWLKSRLR